MKITPAQKRLLQKLAPYPIIWIFGGGVYALVEYGIIGNTGEYPATGQEYSSTATLFSVGFLSVFMGLFIGTLEEVFFKQHFRRFPFFPKIIIKSVVYLSIVVVLLFATSYAAGTLRGRPFGDPELLEDTLIFFNSFSFISVVVYIGAMIDISLFFSEIVDYLGLDIVGNYFTGKYSKPVEERRIFMFLDMKNSTGIAEELGHQQYYQLVNDFYFDMTKPITNTSGEIYQYVGDEIVISWRDTEQNSLNSIKCFYDILSSINSRKQFYTAKYGLVPSFKAGLHVGDVTRGQIGVIKRDLLFTGDVLNSTSRIQELCNTLNTNFLVSCELKKRVERHDFKFQLKGSFALRGKHEELELFTVCPPESSLNPSLLSVAAS